MSSARVTGLFEGSATAIALSLHIGAWLLFAPEDSLHPERWGVQFTILVAISAILSVVILIVRRPAVSAVAVCSKVGILIVIAIPLTEPAYSQLFLTTGFIVECISYLPLAIGVPLATIGSVFVARSEARAHVVWGQTVPDVSSEWLIVLICIPLVVLIVNVAAKALLLELERARKDLDRMTASAEALAKTNLGLQEYSSRAEQRAYVAERERIARELHTILGYALTSQIMMLEHALRLVAPQSDELRSVVSMARTHASEALEEARGAIHALWKRRPSPQNPEDYVRKLIEAFASTDIAIDADFHGLSPNLSERTKWNMYRIVQEAITNALKHGNASQIRISARQHKRTLTVTVYNSVYWTSLARRIDRKPQHSPGRGLSSLAITLSESGGRLVTHHTAEGFLVTAHMPIDMGEHNDEGIVGPAG